MFRVVNVSKKTVSVGGVRIEPLATHVFNENELSQSAMNRITGLANIGVLKIYQITESDETVTKKSSKRK